MTAAVERVRSEGYGPIDRVPSRWIDVVSRDLARRAVGDAHSRSGRGYAIRDLLRKSTTIAALAQRLATGPVIDALLGQGAFPIRALLLDKVEEANWAVPWHQDLVIAVRERVEVPGWGPWSVKEGVVHVQPPRAISERRMALRLHLDDCAADNGPLLVLPRSHQAGVLDASAIARLRQATRVMSTIATRGDIVAMHPLLVHSSRPARTIVHRRVLHLEFARDPLPSGLVWHDTPVTSPA
jgi:ectoine hydroxylase-related dioxygenase (phytanoyl-CoA dioxygenase family)